MTVKYWEAVCCREHRLSTARRCFHPQGSRVRCGWLENMSFMWTPQVQTPVTASICLSEESLNTTLNPQQHPGTVPGSWAWPPGGTSGYPTGNQTTLHRFRNQHVMTVTYYLHRSPKLNKVILNQPAWINIRNVKSLFALMCAIYRQRPQLKNQVYFSTCFLLHCLMTVTPV